MYYKCVVLLFFINYLRLHYLRLTSYFTHTYLILYSYLPHTLLILTSYLPKTYIRPVLTSLLTAIFIILSTWLYNYLLLIIITGDLNLMLVRITRRAFSKSEVAHYYSDLCGMHNLCTYQVSCFFQSMDK